MIDFRYHALSIMGVLMGVALGVVLGVGIGDTGLVSNIKGDIETSLKADVQQARADADRASEQLKLEERFLTQGYPLFVEDRLRGQRVALIGSGTDLAKLTDDAKSALEPTRSRIVFSGEIDSKVEVPRIARMFEIPIEGKFGADEAAKTGRAFGRALLRRRVPAAVRRVAFDRFSGRLGKFDAAVFMRTVSANGSRVSATEASVRSSFETGIIQALTRGGRRIVGAERSDGQDSQSKWYGDRELSSVDNIDSYAGRYALVLVLGGAQGQYGVKKSADRLIPSVAPAT